MTGGTLKPFGSTEDMSFFQVDISLGGEILHHVPERLRHRMIIDFQCIDCISYRKIDQFREWMMNRWNEIPPEGHEAFLSRFVLFLKNQTVAIGESSPTISFKVKTFSDIYKKRFIKIIYNVDYLLITSLFKITNVLSRSPIWSTLIHTLGLTVSNFENPILLEFPDTDPVKNEKVFEKRLVCKVNFHLPSDLEYGSLPNSLLL